jgi:predicted GNAT family acetyltransferase
MTNSEVNQLTIENNEAAGRCEARLGQHLAVIQYQRRSGAIVFIHTEVPPELQGQGVASRLVQMALDDARTTPCGGALLPVCRPLHPDAFRLQIPAASGLP